jgi:hypothetical protein
VTISAAKHAGQAMALLRRSHAHFPDNLSTGSSTPQPGADRDFKRIRGVLSCRTAVSLTYGAHAEKVFCGGMNKLALVGGCGRRTHTPVKSGKKKRAASGPVR